MATNDSTQKNSQSPGLLNKYIFGNKSVHLFKENIINTHFN